jgi:hypothetical protein
MYDAPSGMTLRDFRRHPLRELICLAAYGGKRALPSRHELDALPASVRATVRDVCEEVAALRDTGTHSDAWRLADERAASLIGGLPADLRDADHWRPRDAVANIVDDPAALARLVPRR